MFNIKGGVCPYCQQPLKDSDDLAVCPECGTPHHRECYKQHGSCANAHLHGTGFAWTPPLREEDVIPDVPCPRCGRLNKATAHFCDYCGTAMASELQQHETVQPEPQSAPLFGGMSADNREQVVKQLLAEVGETLDGIPVKDWRTFLGPNYLTYLLNFHKQSRTNNPLSFNLWAFLLPTVYFLYRKLWRQAAVSLLLDILTFIPALVLTVFIPMGTNVLFSTQVWRILNFATALIYFLASLCWGGFSHYFYRKTALRRINRLHNQVLTTEQYEKQLAKSGGVCFPAALVYAFLTFGALFAASLRM